MTSPYGPAQPSSWGWGVGRPAVGPNGIRPAPGAPRAEAESATAPGAAAAPPLLGGAPAAAGGDGIRIDGLMRQVAEDGAGRLIRRLSGIGSDINDYIQQGPDGVRVLCFIAGLLQFATGIAGALSVFNIVLDPCAYVVNFVGTAAGLIICACEAPPEWSERYSELLRIQHVMYDWFKVLTHVAGRGVFYVYLGSVDVVSSYEVISLGALVGLYLIFCGAVCVSTQYGDADAMQYVAPVLEKLRGALSSVKARVGEPEPEAESAPYKLLPDGTSRTPVQVV